MRIALIVSLCLVACGPAPGQRCVGDAVCVSGTEALFCDDGVFAPYKCHGANGCIGNSALTLCDFRESPIGEPCPQFERGLGFCASLSELRKCGPAADPHPVWVSLTCKNCREQDKKILCDL